ncbi:MAG: helix-turn-helix domain-containing protein [Caldisphaera sp.]
MSRTTPKDIKERARKLVMNGTTRKDAAFILGVTSQAVYSWTRDITVPRRRTTSKQERIMKALAEQGYYLPKNVSDFQQKMSITLEFMGVSQKKNIPKYLFIEMLEKSLKDPT